MFIGLYFLFVFQMLAETKPKILELCDKYIDDTIPEYFFDR